MLFRLDRVDKPVVVHMSPIRNRGKTLERWLRTHAMTWACVVAVAVVPAAAAVADPETTLERIESWIGGQYNNQPQVDSDLEQDLAPELQHRLMHQLFVPVQVPALDGFVVFQQSSTDGSTDSDWIIRHGLTQYFIDDTLNVVRLREHTFTNPKAFHNAHLRPEQLRNLTPEDLTHDPACDFLLVLNDGEDQIEGPIPGDNCRLFHPGLKKELIADDRVVIRPNGFWFLGRYVDENDQVMWGTSSDELNQLNRVATIEELNATIGGVLVVGGTRGTGLEIVKLLTESAEHVVVMARPSSDTEELENVGGVQIVRGDALNADEVSAAFASGHYRAVISTLGCGECEVPPDYIGNRHVIDAALAARVPRMILISTVGAGDSEDTLPWPVSWFLRDTAELKTQAEDYLRQSGLEFTILRPGALKSEPATGRGERVEDPTALGIINRADLARITVDVMADPNSVGKTYSVLDPGLSWPWDLF